MFKKISPENTAAWIASFTRTEIRSVELLMAKPQGGISGWALVNLIRAPIGGQVIDYICGDAAPDWRAYELRLIRIAELEQQLDHHKRSLDALREQLGR
jgi:hypothetical protein